MFDVAAASVGVDWAYLAQKAINVSRGFISRGILSIDSLTTVGGLAVVWGMEVVVLGYRKSSFYRLLHPSRSTRTDVFWTLLRILGLNSLILAAISLGFTVACSRVAEKYLGFHVLAKVDNHALRIALYVVATDFIGYWVHRWRHEVGWWWGLHKAHHSAKEFNALTANRGHPFDGVAIAAANAIPLALLGGSVGESIPVLTIFAVHAGLTHSMLPWRWGWFGRYVIYSPTGHRLHHSALLEHRDKNFGGIFPIWDHLFGTYYKGDVLNEEVDVGDNYQNVHGLWFDLVEAARRSARAMRRRPQKAEP